MEDLKYLYRVAGFEGSGISFIFTDNDIKEETFLESLNNVLSSGEIANLFAKDELDEIQSELIPVMKKLQPKRVPTNDNLYDFFITRARENLHVVLCFSPVTRCAKNNNNLLLLFCAGWRKIQEQSTKIPRSNIRLYHTLVPKMAERRFNCCVSAFLGRIRSCCYSRSQTRIN